MHLGLICWVLMAEKKVRSKRSKEQKRIIKQHFEIGENLHYEVDFYMIGAHKGVVIKAL